MVKSSEAKERRSTGLRHSGRVALTSPQPTGLRTCQRLGFVPLKISTGNFRALSQDRNGTVLLNKSHLCQSSSELGFL